MPRIQSICICAAALLVSTGVTKEAAAGNLYLEGHMGAVVVDDGDLSNGKDPDTATLSHEPGFAVGGEVGYGFDSGIRLGGEITFRDNGQDSAEQRGDKLRLSGETESVAFMANAYYDFDTGTAFTPYLGAGVGVALIDFNFATGTGFEDTDAVFAYQAMVGVDYAVAPQIKIGLQYRFFGTQNPSFTDNIASGPITLDGEYQTQNVLLTLRYALE
jgi:OOP family OmpA-OmpF porin